MEIGGLVESGKKTAAKAAQAREISRVADLTTKWALSYTTPQSSVPPDPLMNAGLAAVLYVNSQYDAAGYWMFGDAWPVADLVISFPVLFVGPETGGVAWAYYGTKVPDEGGIADYLMRVASERMGTQPFSDRARDVAEVLVRHRQWVREDAHPSKPLQTDAASRRG